MALLVTTAGWVGLVGLGVGATLPPRPVPVLAPLVVSGLERVPGMGIEPVDMEECEGMGCLVDASLRRASSDFVSLL